jgi:hypothetical protein
MKILFTVLLRLLGYWLAYLAIIHLIAPDWGFFYVCLIGLLVFAPIELMMALKEEFAIRTANKVNSVGNAQVVQSRSNRPEPTPDSR